MILHQLQILYVMEKVQIVIIYTSENFLLLKFPEAPLFIHVFTETLTYSFYQNSLECIPIALTS